MRVYLTYVLFTVSIGLLDALAIYRASSHLGADPLYLGILSFLWSLSYILSTTALGPLGDSNRVRVLSTVAFLATLFSMVSILFSDSLDILAAGYVLHAIGSSAGRIAISIDVMENKDPEEWGYVNSILRSMQWIFRGLAIYLSIEKGYQDLLAIGITTAASALLVTMPQRFFRRAIYRAGLMLEKIYGSVLLRGVTIVSVLEARPGSQYSIEAIWRGLRSDGNPLLTALSASMLTMAFELIATPSPSILVKETGPQGLAMYLYASPILVGASLMIISLLSSSQGLQIAVGRASIAMLILSSLVLAISYGNNSLGVSMLFPLVVFTLSYQLSELDAYNRYSSITAGYDIGRYLAIREVGGLVGGLLSGYIAIIYGYLVSIVAGLALIAISQIVRNIS